MLHTRVCNSTAQVSQTIGVSSIAPTAGQINMNSALPVPVLASKPHTQTPTQSTQAGAGTTVTASYATNN